MARGFIPNHTGDRVLWEGTEYRIASMSRRYRLAELVHDDSGQAAPYPVHFDNLEFAWCPTSHGGPGRPTPDSAL